MPIQGGTRYRKHQVGTQTSFGSNTTATRILPYRGAIAIAPNRTVPDVDLGSLDPVLPSFAGPTEITGPWTGKLAFDDAPYLYGGLLGGAVSPTGATAKTWVWQAASFTSDAFDHLTDEWGDEVTSDVIVAGGGIIDSLEVGFGEDLSAWDVSAQLVYARAHYNASGFTGGLTIDSTPQWVYGADTIVYIDSTPGAIGNTPLVDAVHAASFSVSANNDRKRFANGSNTRFQLAGYGRGAREGTITLTVAKTTATIAERQTLDDTPVPTRYIELKTLSPEIITGSTPYSQSIRVAAELIEATDGEIGGNTTMELTYRVKYDATLGYAYRVVVVNTLASK